MDIVINACYGEFSLSDEALKMLGASSTEECCFDDEDRCNPSIIKCIRKLGERANGPYAKLQIVTIPDENTDWHILDEDGYETLVYVVNGKIHYI